MGRTRLPRLRWRRSPRAREGRLLAGSEQTGPRVLIGVPASPGIGIGVAYVIQREGLIIPEHRVDAGAVELEIDRLHEGLRTTREQLERIHRDVRELEIVDAILRTQILIVEDRQLVDGTVRRIRERRVNAEWAVRDELRRLDRLFEAMEDPYLRERRADLSFIGRRLLLNLMGHEPQGFEAVPGPTIVVAHDLSPAEAAEMDPARVVGIATETGGRTSHTAIMASSFGIPAVVGVEFLTSAVCDGETVVVEGETGRVVVGPRPAVIAGYREQSRRYAAQQRELLRLADLPSETRDGRCVELMGNIERTDELPRLRDCGARGVGLFRTEFLYLNRRHPPDEEEQLQHYRAVLEAVRPDPAVIRTLDLGGDKLPCEFPARREANPALGLRGIRLALSERALFITQLRAMLRAGVYGRLRILLPLVTGVPEVRAFRECLEAVCLELERKGLPYASDVEIGLMIETPAAVTLSDLLAREVDFLSIGTNDLIQYTIAVDRSNEQVAYLYDALHPAVLRDVARVVANAHAAGNRVGVCGEMAGDPLLSYVLLGLGVDELSMNAPAIPQIKRLLRSTTYVEARALVLELCQLSTPAEVADCVRKEMLRRFPGEFERRFGAAPV